MTIGYHANLVRLTTVTTGTGTLTYGSPVTGYVSPPAALNGKTVTFTIEEPGTTPTAREISRGVLDTGAQTLTRVTVLSSTSGGSLVNLTSGASHILFSVASEDLPIVGQSVLDFGAWPGSSLASLAITGQNFITATSAIFCSVQALVSADHTADEHIMDGLQVFGGTIIAGTGFTLYGIPSRTPFLWGTYNVTWGYAV